LFFVVQGQLPNANGYKRLSDITGVLSLVGGYSSVLLTFRMKNMSTNKSIKIEIPEFMEVTFKHEGYDEQKFEGGGHLTHRDGFFYINTKQRELGGHSYYMNLKFRDNLAVDVYTLDGKDEPVRAHLEFDGIENDKYASGMLRLTQVSPYPVGEFDLVEGKLSAKGTFTFRR